MALHETDAFSNTSIHQNIVILSLAPVPSIQAGELSRFELREPAKLKGKDNTTEGRTVAELYGGRYDCCQTHRTISQSWGEGEREGGVGVGEGGR